MDLLGLVGRIVLVVDHTSGVDHTAEVGRIGLEGYIGLVGRIILVVHRLVAADMDSIAGS